MSSSLLRKFKWPSQCGERERLADSFRPLIKKMPIFWDSLAYTRYRFSALRNQFCLPPTFTQMCVCCEKINGGNYFKAAVLKGFEKKAESIRSSRQRTIVMVIDPKCWVITECLVIAAWQCLFVWLMHGGSNHSIP